MTVGEIKTEISKLNKKREAYVNFRDSFIPLGDLNSIFSTLEEIILKFPNIRLDDGYALCESEIIGIYEKINKCSIDLTNIDTLLNEFIFLIDNGLDELYRQMEVLLASSSSSNNNNKSSNKSTSSTPVVAQSSSKPNLVSKGPSFKTNVMVKEM